MKKLGLLLFSLILFACCGEKNDPLYFPSLTIENTDAVADEIIEVKLVGYEFLNLNIQAGTSKTFRLTDGINGGMSYVNIDFKINCNGPQSYYKSMSVNFTEGQTTTIRISDKDPNDTTPMSYGASNWNVIP
jgi:predicted small lipoprotein YifL